MLNMYVPCHLSLSFLFILLFKFKKLVFYIFNVTGLHPHPVGVELWKGLGSNRSSVTKSQIVFLLRLTE